ncbi:class I SAM-dependent methyltransferase [Bartonella sp. HY761]|uniref:class I SAM-dependent methyltransferase n=1 Tax=Bartonella sp. HY761 TaxID=2979330 RepID=UPI0022048860|nr:class I SAM-dependent methyltransferase [Bartonella sp. HY761]UXN06064.1 class I SAM-dependent methyltransferase [Bartonella sp. HY761]
MTNMWHDGYVADIEYTTGTYVEQTPSHMDMVCQLNGIELPVPADADYNYCELGCGRGETSLLIAAANKNANVWAFDFNPAHIFEARRMAEKANLNNVHFEECSFQQIAEEPCPEGMPLFDYITLHGVWSWVSAQNRQYIVQFIKKYLKPGGIVYVSYNTLPAWSEVIPFQKLLFQLALEETGRSDQRVLKAAHRIKDLLPENLRFIPEQFVRELPDNGTYLSHEYLNQDWAPAFHVDVAKDLSEAKLKYVGICTYIENFDEFAFSYKQSKILTATAPQTVETLKDYFINRKFRKDLFTRGSVALQPKKALEQLKKCVLQLAVPKEKILYSIASHVGDLSLNKDLFGPIFDALEKKPMSLGELVTLPGIPELNPNARQIIGLLLAANYVHIIKPIEMQKSREEVRNFNKLYVKTCLEQERKLGILACAASGNGLMMNFLDLIAFDALADGSKPTVNDLAKKIWKRAIERSDSLSFEGNIIPTEADAVRLLKPDLTKVVEQSLPIWQNLGIL